MSFKFYTKASFRFIQISTVYSYFNHVWVAQWYISYFSTTVVHFTFVGSQFYILTSSNELWKNTRFGHPRLIHKFVWGVVGLRQEQGFIHPFNILVLAHAHSYYLKKKVGISKWTELKVNN